MQAQSYAPCVLAWLTQGLHMVLFSCPMEHTAADDSLTSLFSPPEMSLHLHTSQACALFQAWIMYRNVQVLVP